VGSAHPIVRLAEEVVEAIALCDNEADVLEKIARLNIETARIAHERAKVLRERIRPGFVYASSVAESIVLTRGVAA